jgi:hypothetical protein
MKFDRAKLKKAARTRKRQARTYSYGRPSIATGTTLDTRLAKPRGFPQADEASVQTGSTTANFSG